MPAPPAIIDALESVISIYFSGVRHRERAAFILCDNLNEMACKTKAKECDYNFDTSCNFYRAWNAPGVQLPERTLGRRVQGYRDVRNNMQHGSAAATVDAAYCASAILTAVRVIDRLWRNTSRQQLPYWIKVALRVLRLYSEEGDIRQRMDFERVMQAQRWIGDGKRNLAVRQMAIEPGHRDNWGIAILYLTSTVELCLNEAHVPD